MKNRLRKKILYKLAGSGTILTNEQIFKLDPTAGPPPGYLSPSHLTPKGIGIAQQVLSEHRPYGYKLHFEDTVKGKTHYYIAKVEPHSNATKGVSIYELKEGQQPPVISSAPASTSEESKSNLGLQNLLLEDGTTVAPQLPITQIDTSVRSGKVEPEKGKFLEQYKNLVGKDKDAFVIDYVRKYIDSLPMKKLKLQDPTDPTKSIEVEVQPQYFSIEGYPVQVSAAAAEIIANILRAKSGKGYSLPTQEVVRALYEGKSDPSQNPVFLPFKWKSLPKTNDALQYLDHTQTVAQQLSQVNPNQFVVGLMKEKTLPHQGSNLHSIGLLSPVQKNVTTPDGKKVTVLELFNLFSKLTPSDPNYNAYKALVGAHSKDLKMIQDYQGSTGHDKYYVDYSEGTRLMGDIYLNGEVLSFEQLQQKAQQDPAKYGPYYNMIAGGRNYSSYLPSKNVTASNYTYNKIRMLDRYEGLSSILIKKT